MSTPELITAHGVDGLGMSPSEAQLEPWRRLGALAAELTKDANIPFLRADPASVHYSRQTVINYFNLHVADPTSRVLHHIVKNWNSATASRVREVFKGSVPEDISKSVVNVYGPSTTWDGDEIVDNEDGQLEWFIGLMVPEATMGNMMVASLPKSFEPVAATMFREPGLVDGEEIRQTYRVIEAARTTRDPYDNTNDRKLPLWARPYYKQLEKDGASGLQVAPMQNLILDMSARLGSAPGQMRHGVYFDNIFTVLLKFTGTEDQDSDAAVGAGTHVAIGVHKVGEDSRDDFMCIIIGFFFEAFLEKLDAEEKGKVDGSHGGQEVGGIHPDLD